MDILSTWGTLSDYVVQYNFYDTTQADFQGEVVKIVNTFMSYLLFLIVAPSSGPIFPVISPVKYLDTLPYYRIYI